MTSSEVPVWSLVARAQEAQWRKIKEFPRMQLSNLSRLAKSRILDQTQHEESYRRIQVSGVKSSST